MATAVFHERILKFQSFRAGTHFHQLDKRNEFGKFNIHEHVIEKNSSHHNMHDDHSF